MPIDFSSIFGNSEPDRPTGSFLDFSSLFEQERLRQQKLRDLEEAKRLGAMQYQGISENLGIGPEPAPESLRPIDFSPIFGGAFPQATPPGPIQPFVGPPSQADRLREAQRLGAQQYAGISRDLGMGDETGPISTAFQNTAGDIGRSLVGIGTGVEEGLGGIEQAAGDLFLSPQLAAMGQNLGENARRRNELVSYRGPAREPSMSRDVAQSIITSAPQMGLMAGVGVGAGAALLGAQSGGQEYSQARSQGATPLQAGSSALVSGAAEGILERYLGAGRLTEELTGKIARAGNFEEGVKALAKDLALNYGDEAVTDFLQRVGKAVNYSDQQFGPGWLKQNTEAGLAGAVMAGGVQATGIIPASIQQNNAQKMADWQDSMLSAMNEKRRPEALPSTMGPESFFRLNQALQEQRAAGNIPEPNVEPIAPTSNVPPVNPPTREEAPPVQEPAKKGWQRATSAPEEIVHERAHSREPKKRWVNGEWVYKRNREWTGKAFGGDSVQFDRDGKPYHDAGGMWSVGSAPAKGSKVEHIAGLDSPEAQGYFFEQVDAQSEEAKDAPTVVPQKDRVTRTVKGTGFSSKYEVEFSNGQRVPANLFDYLDRKHARGSETNQNTWKSVGHNIVLQDARTGELLGGIRVSSEADTVARETELKAEEGDISFNFGENFRAPARVETPIPPGAMGIVPQTGPPALNLPKRTALQRFVSKWLTSKGGVSTDVRGAIETKESGIEAARGFHKNLADAINRLRSKHLAENPTVDASVFTESMRDVLRGQKPTGPALPVGLQRLLERARMEIDTLSKKNVAQLKQQATELFDRALKMPAGKERSALQAHASTLVERAQNIQSNLGEYLNRAYAAFDDPNHLQKMKDSPHWDRLKADIAALPEMKGKSDAEIEGFMEHLARRKEDFSSAVGAGLGTQEMGIYKRRQEIPLPMRELMGEYTDPAVEFFQTAEKLHRNVATTEMYSALKELGLKEGWLSDRALGGVSSEIGGGAARTPVGGMFATEDMRQMIEDINTRTRKTLLGMLTGTIKVNKTVGSAQGQARNVESNTLLLSAAGNLGTRFMPWGKTQTGRAKAFAASEWSSGKRLAEMAEKQDITKMSPEEFRGDWSRAAELGIVGHHNVDLADIRNFFKESNRLEQNPDLAAKLWGQAKKAYRMGDDIPRYKHWKAETAKILYHSPELSVAEAEAQAASITRDLMPTEGRQARAIKALRKTPLIGGFISFVSEIPRVGKNIARQGLQEVREGNATGNKKMMQVGMQRLISLAATAAVPSAIGSMILALRKSFGDEPDEEEQKWVQAIAPPWMKNSENAIFKVENGVAYVMDTSFMDPWATIKKPILAAIRTGGKEGNGALDAIGAGVMQAGQPYAQEGLGLATVINLVRNQKSTGQEIVDPAAPIGVKAKAYTTEAWKALEPGTVTSLRRLKKAITGEQEPGGRKYSVSTELAAIFGPRMMPLDSRQALKWAANEYLDRQRRSSRALKMVSGREGTVTASELDDAQRTADAAFEAGSRKLLETVEAARGLGLSRDETISILRENKVSAEDIYAAISGADAMRRRWIAKAKTPEERNRRALQ